MAGQRFGQDTDYKADHRKASIKQLSPDKSFSLDLRRSNVLIPVVVLRRRGHSDYAVNQVILSHTQQNVKQAFLRSSPAQARELQNLVPDSD